MNDEEFLNLGIKFDEMGFNQFGWRVLHRDKLVLGNNTQIGSFTVVDAMHGVTIDDDVKIGFGAKILSHSSIGDYSGPVKIGKGAMIGSNAIIMPGNTIGAGEIVRANSYVPPKKVNKKSSNGEE